MKKLQASAQYWVVSMPNTAFPSKKIQFPQSSEEKNIVVSVESPKKTAHESQKKEERSSLSMD